MKVTPVPSSTGFPALSLTTAVIAEELVPSGGMVGGLAVNTIVPVDPPILTLTDWVREVVPTVAVAVMMAVPAVVPAISETVTTPESSGVVTDDGVIVVPVGGFTKAKVTAVPLATGWPVLSRIVAVMAEELVPSAGMESGLATRVMDPITSTSVNSFSVKLPLSAWALIITFSVAVVMLPE